MLPPFNLYQPESLDDALQALSRDNEMQAFSGGTNLIPDLRSKRETCRNFISLDGLDELRYIKREGKRVTLGARTTITDILQDQNMASDAPALHAAVGRFAGTMVRNAATIGGNICCGSPSADCVPALLTLDAEVSLSSTSGNRSVALSDFYSGYKQSVKRPDELLTSVSWNVPAENSANMFYKLALRKGDAITITGVAVLLAAQHSQCTTARLALGSVGPTVFRANGAEAILTGKALDADLIEQAARAAVEQSSPIADIRASAEYRLQTTFSLSRRLLTQAWQQVA